MVDKSYGEVPRSGYSRSRTLQEAASEEIPEAASSNYRGSTAYDPYPMIYMQEADGATLTDVDGNEYVDFHCGVSAMITGHCPDRQVEAVRNQVKRGSYFATSVEAEVEAARLVNDLVPGAERTKFASTGTEAVMTAIKLARAYTGKERILKFEGMYHGHTDYALVNVHPHPENLGTRRNPTKIPEANGVPTATMDTVEAIPWNDPSILEERLERQGDEIAAVITEGVMSNSGLLWPRDGYLRELRRLTERHDVLLILDEVVTGFRMAIDGAQGYFDLEPDLATFGKGLANGYPAAALTGTAPVMEFIETAPDKATFMGTFSGNPLVLAATRANLELLQEIGQSGYEDLFSKGEQFCAGIRDIAADAGEDIFVPEFAGFTAIHFVEPDTHPEQWQDWRDIGGKPDADRYEKFAAEMIGQGYFFPPKTGRINLMHAHTDEHIDGVLEAAKAAMRSLDD